MPDVGLRRLSSALGCPVLALPALPAAAQAEPASRPIKVVVPYRGELIRHRGLREGS